MAEKNKSVYEALAKVDVKPYLEKKGKLNYLSWAKAWGLVKSLYPEATYQIKEFPEYIFTKDRFIETGRQLDYRQTVAGTEVEVTVTIEGQDYTSKLYVMDYKNKVLSNPTYFEINKTQMRCLVKALAFAGLGLDVYAGEDLPEEPAKKQSKQKNKPMKQRLEDYRITFNGQPTTMGILMKHFKEGNSAAVNYVNSLGGEAQKVFEELLNSKVERGN